MTAERTLDFPLKIFFLDVWQIRRLINPAQSRAGSGEGSEAVSAGLRPHLRVRR